MANPITYRKHSIIGNPSAEDDDDYLDYCFVNNGDLDVLTDVENPKCIILGRTGSGKSALIRHLTATTKDKVITIDPDALSLNYLSNSTIISYFESLGINLDTFYQYLWRHIFCVEIIRFHYQISGRGSANTLLSYLSNKFNFDGAKKIAIDYIKEWSDSFWLDTEPRIKEFVNKFETRVGMEVGASHGPLSVKASDARTESGEERGEIVRKGQNVVNSVQMQALHSVISLLSDQLKHQYNHYYIVIDRLDENWVDDSIRYKLIRALIEVIKTFRKISSVKIIVAIRSDLLDRVLEQTRDSGFQAEKYESLFLRIRWTREHLKDLADRRISLLFRRKYTTDSVDFVSLFPNRIQHVHSLAGCGKRVWSRVSGHDSIPSVNSWRRRGCVARMVGRINFSAM